MAVNVGTIETQLSADTRQFVSGMRQAQTTFQNTANTISSGSSQAQASLQQIEVGVRRLQTTFARSMAAIGAGFILPSIFRAANGAIMGFNQTLDSARISMNTFTGSAEKAEEMLGKLQDFAALTPFNFSNLLRTSQQMLAMGVTADELVPRLTAIGDAAAALGGSPEILNRIQRALGQIQAKGRAQAEELLQLAEAGIPAYKYIAELTGGDIPAALDAMKKGQVDAAQAITALLDGMAKDFGGMMEMQSRTLDGAISTVQDYVEMTVGAMGRPIFEAVRDLTLEVADFLGSDAAREGAAQFAENFGAAVKSAAEAIGNFVQTIGPSFVKTLEALYEAARVMAKAIGEAKVALLPFAAALGASVVAVGELAGVITPLLKMFADNKTAVQALAATLLVLHARKRLAADGGMKLVTSLKATRVSIADTIRYQQHMANTMGKNLTAFQAFGTGVKMSMRAASVAVKGFIASMGPMIAVTVAITGLISLYDKWVNRNKELEERTASLTESLKANTDAIIENLEAGTGAIGGYKALEDAILKTGEAGDKITLAFGSIGKEANLKNILQAADNFDQFAFSSLKAAGASDKAADMIVRQVKASEGLTVVGSQVRQIWTKNFAEATGMSQDMAVSLAKDLETLQQSVDNIDLMKVVEDTTALMVGSGQITPLMLEQAKAIAKTTDGYEDLSENQKAALIYTTLVNDVMREGTKTAKEHERYIAGLVNTYSRWADDPLPLTAEQLEEVNEKIKEQTLALGNLSPAWEDAEKRLKSFYDTSEDKTLEEFMRTLLGADAGAVGLQRTMYDLNNQASDFMTTVANLEGSQNDLIGAGYELFDMLFQQGQQMYDLGASIEEVQYRNAGLVQSFVESADAAGYSREAIIDLLKQLYILDMFDPHIAIGIGLDAEELEQQIKQIAVSLTQAERDFDRDGVGGELVNRLQDELDALRAIAKSISGTTAFGSDAIGGGAAIVSGIRDIDDSAQDAIDAAEELQGWIDDLSYAVANLGDDLVGENFAERLMGADPDQIVAEFERIALAAMDLADEASAMGLPGGTGFLQELGRIGDKFDELAIASKSLMATQDALDESLGVYSDLERVVENLEADLSEFEASTDGVVTQMEAMSSALDGFYDAESALGNLRDMFAEFQEVDGLTPRTITDELYDEIDAYDALTAKLDGLKGSGDAFRQGIRDMLAPTVAGAAGAGGALGNYRTILADATAFRDNLIDLKAAGFPADVIRQVVEAGVGNGNIIAKRLLALSSSEMQEFFDLRNQIQSVGASAAQIAGDVVFGAETADAQGEIAKQHSVVQDLFQQAMSQAEQLYQTQRAAAVTAYRDAIGQAQANLRDQESVVNTLRDSLAGAEGEMDNLVGSIQFDLRDAFNYFLGGLGGEITRLLDSTSDRMVRFQQIASGIGNLASPAASAAAVAAVVGSRPAVSKPVTPTPTTPSPSAAQLELQRQQELQRLQDEERRRRNEAARLNAIKANTQQPSVVSKLPIYRKPSLPSGITFRARGGHLGARRLAVVGEKGPELFAPRQSGTVIPNGAGVGGNTYNINVQVNGDPAEAGRQIVRAIQDYERRNGSGWRA